MDVSLVEAGSENLKRTLPQENASKRMHEENLVSGEVSSELYEHKNMLVPENTQKDIAKSSPVVSSCLVNDQPILTKDSRTCQEDTTNSQTINESSIVNSVQMEEAYSGKVLAETPSQSVQVGYQDLQADLEEKNNTDILCEQLKAPQEISNKGSLVENLDCSERNAMENSCTKETEAHSEDAGQLSTHAYSEAPSRIASTSPNCHERELRPSSKGAAEVSTSPQFEKPLGNVSKNSARPRRDARRNSRSLKKKYLLRSSVKTRRVLRSRSQEKPKASESSKKSAADASTGGEARKKRKKRMGKKIEVNEFSRIRKHLRYLLHRMSYEQNLIDAYSSEGWKGLSLEKLKPEKELQRAKDEINRCKLKIRGLFQRIDLLSAEGKLEESLFDSEGEIDSEDIFCAKCGSKDVTLDNDIILCDGACDRGFHQYCLEPPLLKEDIPSGDDGWLCPGCDCKVDCIDLINDSQGTDLSVTDCWEKVFPEAAGGKQNDNAELPSDDSDNDYNPDDPDTDEDDSETGSSTDESDDASVSEGLKGLPHPPPQDEKNFGLSSDDSEDDDYDPDAPDNDANGKEQSSSSDFTSASEDIGAAIDADKSGGQDEEPTSSLMDDGLRPFEGFNGQKSKMAGSKPSLKDELASLQETVSGQEDLEPISSRRHVGRLDYKKLYDETYGNVPSSSSDDEDWRDTVVPKRTKDGNVSPMASNRNTPEFAKVNSETESLSRKRARHTSKGALPKMKMDDMDNSPAKLNKGSPLPGSSGKSPRSSTNNRLGEAVTKRLYQSFKENQYPDRATKESLAEELGLAFRQVYKWFDNARWSSRHSASWELSIIKYTSGKDSNSPQTGKRQLQSNKRSLTRNSGQRKSKVPEETEKAKPVDHQPQASGGQTNGKARKRRRKTVA